ncbi:MAG: hypothetical protein F2813_07250 [Actinobacteria bacterium]|uniref:Unannotated protein n=1 Tax=freshwater metagenome TaxID=449393 RepID=A0A6J5ZVC9_9ZZZZ|nr:hypothetical protein [Actinomycetota bacterium]
MNDIKESPLKRVMTQTLRDYATAQLDAFLAEHESLRDDRDQVIERWMRHLVSVGDVPDDILQSMPEVSRYNEPQVSPQEYECGCVAITRITDRDCRTWLGHDEKPFEMRLAMPCEGAACELVHLRMDQRDACLGTRSEAP